jgi:uncharacterized protein with GYD domain
MATYIILTRLTHEAHAQPGGLRAVAQTVADKIKAECPRVKWKQSYATTGRIDVVDIVESDDPRQIAKAAAIISAEGHANTETLTAMPWKEYLGVL